MARAHSRNGADPDAVNARVRQLLHLDAEPILTVDGEQAALSEALPVDLMADLDRTRAVLARFGRD